MATQDFFLPQYHKICNKLGLFSSTKTGPNNWPRKHTNPARSMSITIFYIQERKKAAIQYRDTELDYK